ncbi:Checkpoint protein hus1-like [Hondaea fermentalgiana]|uniref:Checkpoint protein n=1 Tax=Hondaea fermentalgiana TaxID=2315210 RepID=A0A2R5G079_9STRA|nr:Checkpoint protein hus1-like [Hondaea fermentalgiana]|eukprot:GBG24422.1 Checkpoint protein hus1-like [Hondaea fermentalgiana]
MRFKATLDDTGLRTFLATAQCFSKVCDECALHMSKESFQFRKVADAESDAMLFATLGMDAFTSYDIASKADSTISVLIKVGNLLRAFKSAEQSDKVVFKLTKRQGVPCFSIIAETLSGLSVTQDAPISTFLTVEGLYAYREPNLRKPDISLYSPDPKHVRMVLERMKLLDKFVTLTLTCKGTMQLQVATEIAVMRTKFQGLDSPVEGSGVGKASARLNVTEFIRAMQFGVVSEYDKVIFCIVSKEAMIIYVTFEDDMGTLTYYLPCPWEDDGV